MKKKPTKQKARSRRRRTPLQRWSTTLLRYAIRTSSSLTLAIILLLCTANWFVHQPRPWQERHLTRLPYKITRPLMHTANLFADTTDAIGITGRDVSIRYQGPWATNSILAAGTPRLIPGGLAPADIKILKKEGFTIGYSPSLRHPAWVAYRVHPVTNAVAPPRPSSFRPDPQMPGTPKHSDYTKSGFDRGHMAPNQAIASRFGSVAQRQTFLTSNICPQRPWLNQGPWYDVEHRISELWPDIYGPVWVITGAITPPDAQRLPAGIAIPAGFYQIVMTQHKGELRTFAVYMPQSIQRRDFPRAWLVSIRELEHLSGFNFLAELPAEVQEQIETATATRLLPTGIRGAINLIYQRYRKYK